MADIHDPEIKALIAAERLLVERGGPVGDGDLFEEVLHLENTVLGRYGLPHSTTYRELLRKVYAPDTDNAQVMAILRELENYGELYAREQAIPPVERLARAASAHTDYFEILPRLGITPHTYTVWVYQLLCQERIEADEALLAMNKAEPHLEILGKIQTYYAQATATGVPFLGPYLEENPH